MELISTKYSNIENDIKAMLTPLKNDQTFLRMVKYLSNYPLESEIYVNGNVVTQPDLSTPYDLVGDETVILKLFNQNIVTEAKVYIFLSHLNFNSNESQTILTKHNYVMDILIPYQNIQMDGQLRNVRIVDEVMKNLDNQYISGVDKVFIRKGNDYILNNNYQGVTLYISVDNARV